jgi:hypothetical protein
VLIAAVQGLVHPDLVTQSWNATTNSNYPVFIINGPIATQIRLNSGYGCMGPDPAHPAGASIGRATRLMLQNLGGGLPGVGSMAIHGGPARYTNIVFAEDEAGLPDKGWPSLAEERGFPKGSNTVTVYAVNSTLNLGGGNPGTEDDAKNIFFRYAQAIKAPGYGQYFSSPYNPDGSPGVLALPRGTAQGLASLGWSKEKTKTYLWELTTHTPEEVIKWNETNTVANLKLPKGSPLPITPNAKNFLFVVAGGSQSGHAEWMSTVFAPLKPVTIEAKLPAKDKWDALLKQADADLGPLPPPMQ